MALRATVHKAEIHIADNDRAYYGSHTLTLAQHPSETEERMMVRLLAYACLVTEADDLSFSRGLSDSDEPALWRHDLTGSILAWVDVGLPDERRLLKAIGRADEVVVFAYGRNVRTWWQGLRELPQRRASWRAYAFDVEGTQALARLVSRNMELHINIQDGQFWVGSAQGEAQLNRIDLHEAAAVGSLP